ncbi:MAG TPA: rhodanese-like domain-containing protein [Bacteroidales bacterium]|nr:rhodanese-like domain-containing protein [Bacteroidales bacterium]
MIRLINNYLFIFLFIALVNIVVAQDNTKTTFINLNAHDFYLLSNQGDAIIIDVRLFKEYRKSRIPHALSAPNKEILLQICEKMEKDIPLFVYCDDGDRGNTACQILTDELKFTKVYHLNRGLNEWTDKGYDLDASRVSGLNPDPVNE